MRIFTTALVMTMLVANAPAQEDTLAKASQKKKQAALDYRLIIAKTAAMVSDHKAKGVAARHGLQILNVTWEDTGRFKNSAVGPNISDMTIQIRQKDPETGHYTLTCMPVIRFPNFSDKTADLAIDTFHLLVGNEKGQPLKKLTLGKFLERIQLYLSKSESWKNTKGKQLIAQRDKHVLVSAQACFLPIPKEGGAMFNPVIFNYQSYKGDPAVLTILATREGTSVTVIDNVRDGFKAGHTWGQRLFFNRNGERASLTGKRMSDFQKEQQRVNSDSPTPEHETLNVVGEKGLNMVLLIQVPLKQKNPKPGGGYGGIPYKGVMRSAVPMTDESNVENAVIGHGKVEGPFTEIDNLEIERDTRFPIRVTVQFYKATSNGVVSDKDIAEIAAQIKKVYADADYVGSLVTGGNTSRPTEHDGPWEETPQWWHDFWNLYHKNTGQTPKDAIRMLRKLHGPKWKPSSAAEVEEAVKKLPIPTITTGLPKIMVQVLAKDEAGKEDQSKIDKWVRDALKKRDVTQVRIEHDWFPLTNQDVALIGDKRMGSLTLRMADPRDEKMLTVILDGTPAMQCLIPRKKGATRLVKYIRSGAFVNHSQYLAFRVERAAPGGPRAMEIGPEANGKTIKIKGTSRVIIKLGGNRNSGFSWEVASVDGKAVKVDGKVQYVPDATVEDKPTDTLGLPLDMSDVLVGLGGGVYEVSLRVVGKGKSTVRLAYHGLHFGPTKEPPEKTFHVTLDVQDVPVPTAKGSTEVKQ